MRDIAAATDTDVGEIIAAPPDRRVVARIVAVFGMIKRLLHEPGERLRATTPDRVANELNQFSLQSEDSQCPTPQRPMVEMQRLRIRVGH